MMANKPTMSYVPPFVQQDFSWYEHDGLMAQYNQGKCQDFLRDTDRNFNKTKLVNFDIIHKQCRGEVVSNELLKYHQTVNQTQMSEYPSNDQENILSSAFRTDRKDTFFEKKSIEKHLKKISPKNLIVIFRKCSFQL